MSKPRGAACARVLGAFVLAGIVTSVALPASAGDALDAIDALVPAELRPEAIDGLNSYAPMPELTSVLPSGPPGRRRPQVFAIPEFAPTPARIPRRYLEQRITPTTSRLQDEIGCMATAIYFEARGESYLGQVAVAQVILNRVADPAYPKTICDVVYQASHVTNACQFSFACDGIADVIEEPRAWRWANRIARSVMFRDNRIVDLNTATNYHATYVKPVWAKSMRRLAQVGLHIFYKG